MTAQTMLSVNAPNRAWIHAIAAWAALTFSPPCQCQTVEREPVHDALPLMIRALKAADGQAHGVMNGELADAITRRFDATSPIFIDVSTERRYRQHGCARLKVAFWQDGVRLPDAGTPRRQSIEFGINYCLNGRPPESLQ